MPIPAWIPMAAGGLSSLIANSYGDVERMPQVLDPRHLAYLNQLRGQVATGQGEFGFAPAARAGTATADALAGQRGLSGGAHGAMLSRAIADAISRDAVNRQQFALGVGQLQTNYAMPSVTPDPRAEAWGGIGNALFSYGLDASAAPEKKNTKTMGDYAGPSSSIWGGPQSGQQAYPGFKPGSSQHGQWGAQTLYPRPQPW